SLRQPLLVVEQLPMIRQRFAFEAGTAFAADLHDPLGHAFAPNSLQSFPYCLGHRGGHRFTSKARKFLNESMCLLIFDVQAHGRILPYCSTFLPTAANTVINPTIAEPQIANTISTTHFGAAPILRSTNGKKFQQVRC